MSARAPPLCVLAFASYDRVRHLSSLDMLTALLLLLLCQAVSGGAAGYPQCTKNACLTAAKLQRSACTAALRSTVSVAHCTSTKTTTVSSISTVVSETPTTVTAYAGTTTISTVTVTSGIATTTTTTTLPNGDAPEPQRRWQRAVEAPHGAAIDKRNSYPYRPKQCRDTAAFTSACSCAGVRSGTTTVTDQRSTRTVMRTVTRTATVTSSRTRTATVSVTDFSTTTAADAVTVTTVSSTATVIETQCPARPTFPSAFHIAIYSPDGAPFTGELLHVDQPTAGTQSSGTPALLPADASTFYGATLYLPSNDGQTVESFQIGADRTVYWEDHDRIVFSGGQQVYCYMRPEGPGYTAPACNPQLVCKIYGQSDLAYSYMCENGGTFKYYLLKPSDSAEGCVQVDLVAIQV